MDEKPNNSAGNFLNQPNNKMIYETISSSFETNTLIDNTTFKSSWNILKPSSLFSSLEIDDSHPRTPTTTTSMAESPSINDVLDNLESSMFSLHPDGSASISGSTTTNSATYDTNIGSSSLIAPTPIGPAHSVRVVDEVPLSQVVARAGPSEILECLRPLLLKGRREQRGISTEQPQRSMISSHRTASPPSMKHERVESVVDSSSQLHLHDEQFIPNKKQRISSVPMDAKDETESLGRSSTHSSSGATSPTTTSRGSGSGSSGSASASVKIRAHQSTQWNERYEELIRYKKEFGHCVVPYHYKQNAKLALWVKRQRHQYKLKYEGQHSTMSDEREAALEQLGFVWDSHKAVWQERINELVEYRKKHGHCNVPAKFAENSQLAIWVKCQRRQYKLFCAGERSNMTQARIEKLSEVGFVWDPRSQF